MTGDESGGQGQDGPIDDEPVTDGTDSTQASPTPESASGGDSERPVVDESDADAAEDSGDAASGESDESDESDADAAEDSGDAASGETDESDESDADAADDPGDPAEAVAQGEEGDAADEPGEAEPAEEPPSLQSDRYELRQLIATGGMAEVWLAHDSLLDRPVAVKRLFSQFAGDAAFAERFKREAQAVANLNHPNIVSVYDWAVDGDDQYLVMEHVKGRSLAEILHAEGRLHPDRAADIAIDVTAALTLAHREGMVHKDIKPGNIMITDDGRVQVLDFGIARAVGGGDESLTDVGTVMGTATYFSPEQAQGLQVGPRGDLYSLGVVLFEMTVGRPPFTGKTPVAIAYQHVRDEAPSPTEFAPDVPPEIEAITLKLLDKDPDLRYPSAEDLRSDLRRYREGHRMGQPVPVPVPIPDPTPPPPPGGPPHKPAQ
jgi:serine/threonine protein kinase